MRIAHVVVTDAFAGTERYVVDVAGAQAAAGHDVAVVGGRAETVRAALPPEVRWLPGDTPRVALASLVSIGRRDVVHSHLTKADFVAVAAAPANRARRFSTRHITAERGYGRPARLLAPLVRRALTAEIAVSEFVAGTVVPRSDVVLLNGVVNRPDTTGDREPLVVMAHRLAPEKDTATGLRAWALSRLQERGWRLVVAGTGPEGPALERLADELGISASTTFPGWVADPDTLLRSASVLLAPAPAEPCGLTILEAMAWATPVVTVAAGGPLETVGRVGSPALFPPGDAAAAAAALLRLADDPAAAAGYGRALRSVQRAQFDLAGHTARLLEVYRGPRAG